ncbi:calcium/sodium antiporter [Candidatus Nitrotoga arctica]|uniref:Sodium:calcium antiporter n=1 Tax=Candidatus Nitrotoga arctica TaxID=453162 RepID=A0ABN8AKR7_9PROT|nr:calcium/sodium antiporter [Candidatus Nitrotoga arctica]CAG9933349.1 Sodium:calcium antiporter [Candidatus Nitrotoga arctica]
MQPHPAIIFLGGLVVIIVGAEVLLRGATRMAAMLNIQPILIGLTVVAIGTSMPELAVGITAAYEGKGPLSVGNIAGGNLFILLFVLGLSALYRPLPLRLQSIKFDVPVMIATSLMLIAMAWDGVLSRTEGAILVGASIAYFTTLVRLSRRESARMKLEFAQEYSPSALKTRPSPRQWAWKGLLLAGGIALTIIGANLLVAGAVDIATSFGVSDAVIGLTIVAFGTNAPELTTTLVATLKDDRDVAIGNLIGSSITNILVILGLICLAAPGGIEVSSDVLRIDLPLAALVALVCLPVFRSDQKVTRREGAFFVAAYIAYLSSLLLLRT